jgi:hypothetical protein
MLFSFCTHILTTVINARWNLIYFELCDIHTLKEAVFLKFSLKKWRMINKKKYEKVLDGQATCRLHSKFNGH